MAVGYNPRIVTDGLVLALDAGNTKSYPGSGSDWYDLSGNDNNFTLFNSPSYSSAGYINFDGVNDYARSTSTLDLSPYNQITIEIGMRVNTTSTPSGMAFEHSSNWNTQSMGFGLLPNSSGGTTYTSNRHHTNQPSGSGVFDYNGVLGTDITFHTNIWSRIGDSTGRNAYINAIERSVTLGSTTTSSYPSFRNDYLYISSRAGTSVFANHRVYFLRIYGRKLTPQEIQQNFNAVRGRFGI